MLEKLRQALINFVNPVKSVVREPEVTATWKTSEKNLQATKPVSRVVRKPLWVVSKKLKPHPEGKVLKLATELRFDSKRSAERFCRILGKV